MIEHRNVMREMEGNAIGNASGKEQEMTMRREVQELHDENENLRKQLVRLKKDYEEQMDVKEEENKNTRNEIKVITKKLNWHHYKTKTLEKDLRTMDRSNQIWKDMCEAHAPHPNDDVKNENMRCQREIEKLEHELKVEKKNISWIKSEQDNVKSTLELKQEEIECQKEVIQTQTSKLDKLSLDAKNEKIKHQEIMIQTVESHESKIQMLEDCIVRRDQEMQKLEKENMSKNHENVNENNDVESENKVEGSMNQPNNDNGEDKDEEDIDLVCNNKALNNQMYPEKHESEVQKEDVENEDLPGMSCKPPGLFCKPSNMEDEESIKVDSEDYEIETPDVNKTKRTNYIKNKEELGWSNVGKNGKTKKEETKEWRKELMVLKPEIKACIKWLEEAMTETKKNKSKNLHETFKTGEKHKQFDTTKDDLLRLMKNVKDMDDLLLTQARHKDAKRWGGSIMYMLKEMGGKSHSKWHEETGKHEKSICEK